MADQETKPDERLERLLRRWGANEAVRGADVSGLPAPRSSAVRTGWLWRWMPLAASIVLLVGALALFFADYGPTPTVAKAPSPAAMAQIKKLQAESEELKTDLAAAREQVTAMERDLAETAKLRADLARATGQLDVMKDQIALTEKLHADLANARKRLAKSEAELAEATIQLYGKDKFSGNGRNTATLQAALHKAQSALAEKQAWFKAEIARVGRDKSIPAVEMEKIIAKRVDKALKELDRDWTRQQKQMAELKKQLAEVTRERTAAHELLLQRAYLSGAAPGKEGYEARQHAARDKLLLDRCAELRPKLTSAEQRNAFDAIEVLLTRLDLLDVHDEAAVEPFRALVKQVDVRKTVTAAWETEGADLVVNRWLQEITFLLAEY